jgi:hypothetical protein
MGVMAVEHDMESRVDQFASASHILNVVQFIVQEMISVARELPVKRYPALGPAGPEVHHD